MNTESPHAPWRPGKRVAIIGAGPGGVSTAMAMHMQGYDVRLYERAAEPKALGGGVLLSTPVLAVLRHYGLDISEFGAFTRTEFRNNKGRVRVRLPFNPEVEEALGIKGWSYGVLRESAFRRMLDRLETMAPGSVVPGHDFRSYDEGADGEVTLHFADHDDVTCDIVVGADGIRSRVSTQAFGDPHLFHIGLRLYLAWCGPIPDLPHDMGALHHSRNVQASYFPMMHEGEKAFEWWVVEPADEGDPVPEDIRAHLEEVLDDFPPLMRRFLDNTDVDTQLFRWEIYNRESLESFTSGRIACVGDAAHPVSPYAAYGMGMAIEDGYFLARELGGADLRDAEGVSRAFARYDEERVRYTNLQVESARGLGKQFHHSSRVGGIIRDFMFDHTPLIRRGIAQSTLKEAMDMTMSLTELHVR